MTRSTAMLGLLLVLTSSVGLAVPTPRSAATVPTQSGPVRGVPFGVPLMGLRFLGIPYAAPPTGERRWRPPAPPTPWTGVRSGSDFGPACPQHPDPPSLYADGVAATALLPGREYFRTWRTDEDCLYLNVWTHDLRPASMAPVVVFVHGGSNLEGSGQVVSLAHTFVPKGVVVVTFNYRLGALGFLAHPALSAESPRHVSGNYALLDILAALDWVHDNIAAFGGDPANVTLMGESAGAWNVYVLLTSPRAAGRFQRAILQSGSAAVILVPTLDRPTWFPGGTESAEDAGVALARDFGAGDGPQALAALRRLPADEILTMAAAKGHAAIDVNIDGWVLPRQPGAVFAAGEQIRVPLLVGSNANESTMFAGGAPSTADAYRAQVEGIVGAGAPALLALQPVDGDAAVATASEGFMEEMFAAGAHWPVERMRAVGSPACQYLFTYRARGRRASWGAYHSLELSFLADDFDPASWGPVLAADRAMSSTLVELWTQFVKSGTPRAAGVPAWRCAMAQDDTVYELGSHLGPIPRPRRAGTDVFEAVLRSNLERIGARPRL